jgi:hypothetical protein
MSYNFMQLVVYYTRSFERVLQKIQKNLLLDEYRSYWINTEVIKLLLS